MDNKAGNLRTLESNATKATGGKRKVLSCCRPFQRQMRSQRKSNQVAKAQNPVLIKPTSQYCCQNKIFR